MSSDIEGAERIEATHDVLRGGVATPFAEKETPSFLPW